MFGFIFRSVKMLIVWIIIGIAASYIYGLAKPYLNRVQPAVNQSIGKVVNNAENLKKVEALNSMVNKALKKANVLKNKIVDNKEPEYKEGKVDKVEIAKHSDNQSNEEELFDRQMNIVNELMN